VIDQPLQGQAVAGGPEAADHPQGLVGQIGVVAKGLAGVDVAQVHLHKRDRHGQQGITQGDGGVGVGAGIDQQAFALAPGRLDAIHQDPLVVALEALQLGPQGLGPGRQGAVDLVEAAAAVEAGLPLAQQVEVGTVKHEQAHGGQGDRRAGKF